jgi:hypothetical protein
LFGQKSPLFNLLQLAPEFIAIHHDLTGVTLPGFGMVARVSSDADDKCQFGNGHFPPGQYNNSKVLLDIVKRRNLADAIRTDRLNGENRMMDTCVLFNLLHKEIPRQGLKADLLHPNNVVEMETYNSSNINNNQDWKQNDSIATKAAVALLVACEARLKSLAVSLMGDEWNKELLSYLGMTTQFNETQGSKFLSSPGQLKEMYNPKKRWLPGELLLTTIIKSRPNWCPLLDYAFGDPVSDSQLKPHPSWSNDKSDPSEIALSKAPDGTHLK